MSRKEIPSHQKNVILEITAEDTTEEDVEVMTYVDGPGRTEGKVDKFVSPLGQGIASDMCRELTLRIQYITWLLKAIEDGIKCGMPQSYADKYIMPFIPTLESGQRPPQSQSMMIRTMKMAEDARPIPRGTGPHW